MLKTIDVTLNEQQVSLVLGMIWYGKKLGIFDESEDALVSQTESLFEGLENEMYQDSI